MGDRGRASNALVMSITTPPNESPRVGKVDGGLQVVGDVLHSTARDARETNWGEGAEPSEVTGADARPGSVHLTEHLDGSGLGGKKGGLSFGKGGDGRADSLEGPQSSALNV